MKKRIVFSLALFCCTMIWGQNFTQTVRGRVIDTDTQLPIMGASIIVVDSDPLKGSVTDADGKFRLEKIPVGRINLPNHFADQNAVLGSTSILDSNLLATSDFYTGAFPAEFGNAISGIYDIRLRNGNNEKGGRHSWRRPNRNRPESGRAIEKRLRWVIYGQLSLFHHRYIE